MVVKIKRHQPVQIRQKFHLEEKTLDLITTKLMMSTHSNNVNAVTRLEHGFSTGILNPVLDLSLTNQLRLRKISKLFHKDSQLPKMETILHKRKLCNITALLHLAVLS